MSNKLMYELEISKDDRKTLIEVLSNLKKNIQIGYTDEYEGKREKFIKK